MEYEGYRTVNPSGSAGRIAAELILAGKMKGELSPEAKERLLSNMARKPKVASQALKLGEALSFVAAAGLDTGLGPYQSHVRFADKTVFAFDGVLAAGHPVEEELTSCPHAGRLLDAITKCGKTLAITETDGGRLSIKGDKLRAVVPCLPVETMPPVGPDQNIAPIDDRLKAAFACVGVLITEAGTSVVEAAALLQANSVISTNGSAAIEYWHGIDLPPNLVIPKRFINAVAKTAKPLVGFGWTEGKSITFWFEDGAWLKTQLYADPYPDMRQFLDQPIYPVDVPDGFYEGIEAVATFNEQGFVTFAEGQVQSHDSEEIGAQYEVPNLPAGKSFAAKVLKTVSPFAPKIDITTYGDRMFFVGGEQANPVRGVVVCVINQVAPPQTEQHD